MRAGPARRRPAAVLGGRVRAEHGQLRAGRPGRRRRRPGGSPGWSRSRAARRAGRCRRWPRPTRCSIAARAPCADVHHHARAGRSTCRLTTTSGTSRLSCSIRLLLIRGLHSSTPVDLLGQGVDQLLLDRRVLVGVGDEDVVVALPGLALRRLDQRREERVGDVGDDQADVVGAPGDQRPGGAVGPVAQVLRGGQHPAAGLRVDQVRCGERAGHRGDVHAGGPGDVADGRLGTGGSSRLVDVAVRSRRWGQLMQTVAAMSTADGLQLCCSPRPRSDLHRANH